MMAEKSSLLTVRHATFDLLRHFGLTTIFGNPGSTELPMFRDFPDDFRYVLGLQEAVVVAMADGYAQATRGVALVNLHSAAGVGHAMGNIFTAFRNNTPLVITVGQQARSMLPYDPFLYSAQATEFPKPYVKYSVQPARAADVPVALARAYYMAIMPPCGPTFVSIPVDDWDAPAQTCVIPRTVSHSIRADIEAIAPIKRALIAARSPAFVVGPAVDRDGAFNLTVELAERCNAVVYVSPKSARCSFPEDHSLFRGFLQSTRSDILSSLAGHDVILVLGAPAFLYHFEDDGSYAFPNGIMFQLTEDPELAAAAPVGTAVLTSVHAGIQDLLAEPALPHITNRSTNVSQKPKDKVPNTHPMSDAYLMQTLHSIRPKNSIIVEEASSSRPAIQKFLPMTHSESFYTHASGGLGYSLPASVGIALAKPDQRIIAIIGDGAAMYSIQALYTAVQLGLSNITFIIVNNQRYEVLNSFARRFGLSTAIGSDLPGLDFVAIAKGQGCHGLRVEKAEELVQVLTESLTSTQPTLVEVIVK